MRLLEKNKTNKFRFKSLIITNLINLIEKIKRKLSKHYQRTCLIII